MIHVVNCNGRDCPWFKRRMCKHPLMKKEDRGLGVWPDGHGPPLTCPLRKNIDIIVPGSIPGDEPLNIEEVVKDGTVQLEMWLALHRVAKKK